MDKKGKRILGGALVIGMVAGEPDSRSRQEATVITIVPSPVPIWSTPRRRLWITSTAAW
jgi:hypothetical protein